jgi:hypothetical protein
MGLRTAHGVQKASGVMQTLFAITPASARVLLPSMT